jgi:hypothetical protein
MLGRDINLDSLNAVALDDACPLFFLDLFVDHMFLVRIHQADEPLNL